MRKLNLNKIQQTKLEDNGSRKAHSRNRSTKQ